MFRMSSDSELDWGSYWLDSKYHAPLISSSLPKAMNKAVMQCAIGFFCGWLVIIFSTTPAYTWFSNCWIFFCCFWCFGVSAQQHLYQWCFWVRKWKMMILIILGSTTYILPKQNLEGFFDDYTCNLWLNRFNVLIHILKNCPLQLFVPG